MLSILVEYVWQLVNHCVVADSQEKVVILNQRQTRIIFSHDFRHTSSVNERATERVFPPKFIRGRDRVRNQASRRSQEHLRADEANCGMRDQMPTHDRER